MESEDCQDLLFVMCACNGGAAIPAARSLGRGVGRISGARSGAWAKGPGNGEVLHPCAVGAGEAREGCKCKGDFQLPIFACRTGVR